MRLHGHVTEERKRELYQQAWVNATASSAEGWALSVMEAAACATPTAALAVGGVQESVEDGRTGLLARDPAELAERIQLILRDPELRDSLGAAALERARGFTWDATARRTLEVLEAQVAGRRCGRRDPPALERERRRARPRPGVSFEAALAAVDGVEGWLSDGQARRLWDRAGAVPPGGRIVEIGSFRGRSAIVLARAVGAAGWR